MELFMDKTEDFLFLGWACRSIFDQILIAINIKFDIYWQLLEI